MLEKYALIKVMKEVLVNAASVYSVNGTAKKAGVSVFAAKHALDDLYKKGMLTRLELFRNQNMVLMGTVTSPAVSST